MPKPWENAEGYHDPTAYHGTKNMRGITTIQIAILK